jgi:hypothetical protein
MGKPGVAAGVGLLLTVAACTSGPAPKPAPSSSRAPSSSAASPEAADASCTDPVDQPSALPGDYRLVAGVAAVPTGRLFQVSPSGEHGPAVKLFAKWGLVVRTGRTVQIAVAPGWENKARVGWGNPGTPATSVRVTACPVGSAPAPWTAFAGGTWVAAPACVPFVIRAGGRSERIRFPIGVPCA